jgi:hypothetical protein
MIFVGDHFFPLAPRWPGGVGGVGGVNRGKLAAAHLTRPPLGDVHPLPPMGGEG